MPEMDIQAGKQIKEGLAYSGGFLRLPGWDLPVIVDLSGLEIDGEIPLLADHDNKTRSRLGVVRASIRGENLYFSGEILSENEVAKNIVAQQSWQVSIGAEPRQSSKVASGTKFINGRTVNAPFYWVQFSKLREISIVPVGVDSNTKMIVASQMYLIGGKELAENEKEIPVVVAPPVQSPPEPKQVQASINTEDLLKAERNRISSIRGVCQGENADIEQRAIEAGWSVEQTCKELLPVVRASRPTPPAPAIQAKNQPDRMKAIEASFCMRAGFTDEILVKTYGEQTIEAALKEPASLHVLFEAACEREGKAHPRSFDNETIRAAFSTVSLPGTLGNVANKALMKAYADTQIYATRLCTSGDLNDFKTHERYRITDMGILEQVAPDGEIKHGSLNEQKATNKLETYGKQICLTRQMIINDDLGAFLKIPTMIGVRAAKMIDRLFFTRLLSNPTMEDTVALFHTATHRNYRANADTALSATSLQFGISKILLQYDADGQPLDLSPRFLVVPPELKWTAIELTKSQLMITTGGDTIGGAVTTKPALNALSLDGLEVLTPPYLSNSAYSGYSAVAWYLFCDPAAAGVETFEIGYLRGKRTPTIEQGETDWNTLGQWYRVYFDIGVREQDFRGMYKGKGEA
jgi:hypothetical protein